MNITAGHSISSFRLFAVTPPGLEHTTFFELEQMGGIGSPVMESGGVGFSGPLEILYKANLWLRTANRVLLRIAGFRATELDGFEEKIQRYPWELYLPSGGVVKVNASSHKSRIYHSGAVEERVIRGIGHRIGKSVASWRLARKSGVSFDLLVVIRFVRDKCMISVDSSGEDLYRRGYKKDVGRASLRENLAAGLLIAAGWDGKSPVLDPMCGSGTIAIEAAMSAAAMAPGLYRHFAFEKWKNFDRDMWEQLRQEARQQALKVRRSSLEFFASDYDVEAVKSARLNAQRAGVTDILKIKKESVAKLVRPEELEHGWIISNPPYGKRIKQSRELTGLYSTLGRRFRDNFQGWDIALLCPDYRLQKALALHVRKIASIKNGGTRVDILSSAGKGEIRGNSQGSYQE
jgi:putative N6-adenine-specific DNA methylase